MNGNWTIDEVNRIRNGIVKELQELKSLSLQQRLLYLVNKLKEKANSTEALYQASSFIYIMCALVHHIQHGGLAESDVKRLLLDAESILKLNQIPKKKGALSVLHGELCMVRSQLALNAGEFWSAINNQIMAERVSGKYLPGGEAFQQLSLGIKSQRLGFCELAGEHFQKAEEQSQQGRIFEQARIGRIRSLRLSCRVEDARQLIEESLSEDSITETLQRELTWERCCLPDSRGPEGILNTMFDLVHKEKTHFSGSYIVELQFWAWAFPNFRWMRRLPKLKTLQRRSELDLKSMGTFYRIAQIMEKLYDDTVIFDARLEKLDQALQLAGKLRTIDKELLFWLALARWCGRQNLEDYQRLCEAQYRAISQNLSQHRSSDCLHLIESETAPILSA